MIWNIPFKAVEYAKRVFNYSKFSWAEIKQLLIGRDQIESELYLLLFIHFYFVKMDNNWWLSDESSFQVNLISIKIIPVDSQRVIDPVSLTIIHSIIHLIILSSKRSSIPRKWLINYQYTEIITSNESWFIKWLIQRQFQKLRETSIF